MPQNPMSNQSYYIIISNNDITPGVDLADNVSIDFKNFDTSSQNPLIINSSLNSVTKI